MSEEQMTLATELEPLLDHLRRLTDGSESVSAFNMWFFMNAAWEDRASDDTLDDLGAAIESILYQWQDFPDLLPAKAIVREITSAIQEAQMVLPFDIDLQENKIRPMTYVIRLSPVSEVVPESHVQSGHSGTPILRSSWSPETTSNPNRPISFV